MTTVTLPSPPEIEKDLAQHCVWRFSDSQAPELSVLQRPQQPIDLCLHQLEPGDSRVFGDPEDYVSLICTEGQLELQTPKNSIHILSRFHSFLLAPGERAKLTSQQAAKLVACHYRAPKDQKRSIPTSDPVSFERLKPIRRKPLLKLIPQAFRAVLSPRDLYLLIGPKRARLKYGITGPDRFLITLASTPLHTGPALHVHRHTKEIFMVMEGRFKVSWGDNGEHHTILDRYDTIAIPPGVNRAFENIGGEPNWLMPIVVGADDELDDIVWLPEVARELSRQLSSAWLWLAKTFVLKFGQRPPSP